MPSQAIYLASVFGLGLATGLSPCLYPVLPTFVTQIVATSENRKQGFEAGLACTLGIMMSFLAFGLLASLIGSFMLFYYSQLNVLMGVIIILLGVIMLTPLKQIFTRLSHDFTMNFKGIRGAFVVGAIFAFIAAPCGAPALLGIILIASVSDFLWASVYTLIFGFGAGIPFLIMGIFAQKIDDSRIRQRFSYLVRWSSQITGIILIVVGIWLVLEYGIL